MKVSDSVPILMCWLIAGCSGGGDGASGVPAGGLTSGSCDAACVQNGEVTQALSTTVLDGALLTQGGVTSSYDSVTQTFTVRVAGSDISMQRFPVADHGVMLAMRDAAGIHNAYLGAGSGTKVVIYSGGLAGNVVNIGGYERTSAVALPKSGRAIFNGQYAGFTTTRRVNGTVSLDVDFAGNSLNGSIRDRKLRQRPDNVYDAVNPLSDIVLEKTVLAAGGTFSGVTGGGQIVGGQELWNPATGHFAGLIGGQNGAEAVGIVNLTHHAPSGGSFDEIGGFLALK